VVRSLSPEPTFAAGEAASLRVLGQTSMVNWDAKLQNGSIMLFEDLKEGIFMYLGKMRYQKHRFLQGRGTPRPFC